MSRKFLTVSAIVLAAGMLSASGAMADNITLPGDGSGPTICVINVLPDGHFGSINHCPIGSIIAVGDLSAVNKAEAAKMVDALGTKDVSILEACDHDLTQACDNP